MYLMKNRPSENNQIGILFSVIVVVILTATLFKFVLPKSTNFFFILLILAILGAVVYFSNKRHERKHRIPQHKQYEDSRLTDFMMEKLKESYDIKEETTPIIEEYENEEKDDGTLIYTSKPEYGGNGMQSILYGEEAEKATGFKALFLPAKLPITLAEAWIVTAVIIQTFFPQIRDVISSFVSFSIFVMFPVFFLLGLSGLLGILFKSSRESIEITSKERMDSMLNILKILVGWGVGIYIFLKNFSL